MRCLQLHPWDLNYDDAVEIQRKLSSQVILTPFKSKINLVAGADVSYSKGSDTFYSGVVVIDTANMSVVEESTDKGKVSFPYIPGLLSFREAPVLIKAFEKLKHVPDVVIFDGQGIAHPRGLGIASHMGLILEIPTIGCAKNLLVGRYTNLGEEAGDFSYLTFAGKAVGVALRTKKGVSPVFVSPGHKIDIPSSIDIILSLCCGYRIPEPLRLAHILVNRVRSANEQIR